MGVNGLCTAAYNGDADGHIVFANRGTYKAAPNVRIAIKYLLLRTP